MKAVGIQLITVVVLVVVVAFSPPVAAANRPKRTPTAPPRVIAALTAPTLLAPPDGAIVPPHPTLSWTATPGAVRYHLQMGPGPNFDQQSNVMDDTSLTDNSFYIYFTPEAYTPQLYWHVQAIDANGNFGPWSTTWSFTIKLAAPTLISPANGATVPPNPTLTWSAVAGATRYRLEIASNSTFDYPQIIIQSWQTSTSYTFSGHPETNGMPLYWRVQAIDDPAVLFGPWSAVGTFTIQ